MSEHTISTKSYYLVFLALMAGTALTTWVAFLDLGWFNTPVALSIAWTKAMLVVLYFMHVRQSTKLTKLVAAAGVFWLLLLLGLTMGDIATRGWLGSPGK
ncbi:MAG: oxidase [Bryobacterales bacterium]|nr:oxidase [Bryobacterales bacterium]